MLPVDSASYRIVNGRTKMLLYRNMETELIEADPDPYCFMPAKWEVNTKGRMERTNMKTFDTLENVKRYSFLTPDSVKAFRAAVEATGKTTYEADKKYVERWMLANAVTCGDYPNYASWDTEESNSQGQPTVENAKIIAAGFYYRGETITFTGAEDKILRDSVDFLTTNKITLLKGWNSGTHSVKQGWDLPIFTRRLSANRIPFDTRSIRFVDSSLLYRYLEKNYKQSWSLEKVGKRLLQLEKPFVDRKISSLSDADLRERVGWDARITGTIDDKKKYSLLAIDLAKRAAQFPDAILGMNPKKKTITVTPTLDNWIIRQANKVGYVMPNKTQYDKVKYQGAWVYVFKKGTYYNVAQFDFDSLYPNVMLAFKIAPYDRFDVWFPIIETFLQGKKKAQGEERWGYKILSNAMYGLQASSYYRFKCADKALATAANARGITKAVADFLTSLGYIVYKGETDSVFVQANSPDDIETIQQLINNFVHEHFHVDNINMAYEAYWENLTFPRAAAREENRKKYFGKIKLDKDRNEVNEFHVVGMEYLRNDWSDIAKEVQDRVMRMKSMEYASKEQIDAYANEVVSNLLAGKYDDKLILEKGLTRPIDQYGKPKLDPKTGKMRKTPIPQHVKAMKDAFQHGWVPSDMIQYEHCRYILTKGGKPKLVNLVTPDEIDRPWYLERQIYPILQRLDVIDAVPRVKPQSQTTLD